MTLLDKLLERSAANNNMLIRFETFYQKGIITTSMIFHIILLLLMRGHIYIYIYIYIHIYTYFYICLSGG
jgi:hypothetical protein